MKKRENRIVITVQGVVASGKTTIVSIICQALMDANLPVVHQLLTFSGDHARRGCELEGMTNTVRKSLRQITVVERFTRKQPVVVTEPRKRKTK